MVARCDRGQRLRARRVARLADPHAQLAGRALRVVVTADAALDARWCVIGVRRRRRALCMALLAANRGAAAIRAVMRVIEAKVAFDQPRARALVDAVLVTAD